MHNSATNNVHDDSEEKVEDNGIAEDFYVSFLRKICTLSF